MYQRINITLPNETLQLLDRIAPKGDRSHLIDQAVKYYINAEAKKNLRDKLKQGAMHRTDRDSRTEEAKLDRYLLLEYWVRLAKAHAYKQLQKSA